jgi:hypothetical protein
MSDVDRAFQRAGFKGHPDAAMELDVALVDDRPGGGSPSATIWELNE